MQPRQHLGKGARLLGAVCQTVVLLVSPGLTAATPEDDLVGCITNVVRIAVEIDEAGMEMLRTPRSDGPKPRARATVTEGDHRYTNVSVQLKGFTTFRSVDDRPSLTLKFDRHAAGQTFHGLTKISLNNSLQDTTRLNEMLARELFAAAGVPVPRASHAVVKLNGRELGLYVLAEGFDETFLARHFTRTDGTLYEGGTLQDIDATPRPNSEERRGEHAALLQLIAATHETNPEKRFEKLSQMLDMDRFLSMATMETILCHSDSYSMNRNNYRFYRDPSTGRFTFMPHGMDRILGTHRSGLDLSIVPPQLGLVTRSILSSATGRRRYLDRLGTLLTNVFQPSNLCSRIRQIDRRLLEESKKGPPFPGRSTSSVGAHNLCQRIEERFEDLVLQMSTLRPYFEEPRFPTFDSNRVHHLKDWMLRPSAGATSAGLKRIEKQGRTFLRLTATNGMGTFSMRNRLTLPAGRYQFSGAIDSGGPPDSSPVLGLTLNRWSGGRFQLRTINLNPQALDAVIVVGEAYAPEEIELIAVVRPARPQIQLDITTLRLHEERSFAPADSSR